MIKHLLYRLGRIARSNGLITRAQWFDFCATIDTLPREAK